MTKYDAMLWYLVRLRRDDGIPWPRALAWSVAAYRTRFTSEAGYIELTRELEADARLMLAHIASDRAKAKRAKDRAKRLRLRVQRTLNAAVIPRKLHILMHEEDSPGWQAAIATSWLIQRETGGASMRATPLPRHAPVPISVRVIPADSQPAMRLEPDQIAEDVPMPDLWAEVEQLDEPGHLLAPDMVAALAEQLNARRL